MVRVHEIERGLGDAVGDLLRANSDRGLDLTLDLLVDLLAYARPVTQRPLAVELARQVARSGSRSARFIEEGLGAVVAHSRGGTPVAMLCTE